LELSDAIVKLDEFVVHGPRDVSTTPGRASEEIPARLSRSRCPAEAALESVHAVAGAHSPDGNGVGRTVRRAAERKTGPLTEGRAVAPTFRRGFGFHPLCALLDRGPPAPESR
jgi:hypothetical protein